jgi:hypothetical protein
MIIVFSFFQVDGGTLASMNFVEFNESSDPPEKWGLSADRFKI